MEVLDNILSRHGWFTAARAVRAHLTGKADERLTLAAMGRVLPLLSLQEIDLGHLLAPKSEQEIIDRFLQLDNYRIVAEEDGENTSDNDILTEAKLDDEDDLVSEELAEVYLSQGLKSEAIAIYSKLSLLNPKKSVYFAELIEQIEKQ